MLISKVRKLIGRAVSQIGTQKTLTALLVTLALTLGTASALNVRTLGTTALFGPQWDSNFWTYVSQFDKENGIITTSDANAANLLSNRIDFVNATGSAVVHLHWEASSADITFGVYYAVGPANKSGDMGDTSDDKYTYNYIELTHSTAASGDMMFNLQDYTELQAPFTAIRLSYKENTVVQVAFSVTLTYVEDPN